MALTDGTTSRDEIFGSFQDDVLRGFAGDDSIYAYGGNDVVDGGEGADEIYGGDGADDLTGGTGGDRIYGGAGNDRVHGDVDNNEGYEGGAGYDYVDFTRMTFALDLEYQGGSSITEPNNAPAHLQSIVDFEEILGSTFADRIDLRSAIDVVRGGQGNDSLYGFAGAAADGSGDTIYGGDGFDFIDGRGGDDRLLGGDDADFIQGGDGNDDIYGGTGDDVLRGETGRDALFGGAGADTLSGGADGDKLKGNAGDDTLRGDNGRDRLVGGGADDLLFGGNENDRLKGSAGDDALFGGAGDDQLYGGRGADTFVIYPDGGTDTIHDFNAGQGDVIQIPHFAQFPRSYDEIIANASAVLGGTLIDLGDGASVQINGIAPAALDESFFVFENFLIDTF